MFFFAKTSISRPKMSRRYLFTVAVFALWIFSFYLASRIGGIDLLGLFLKESPMSVIFGLCFYLVAVSTGIFILYRSLKYAGVNARLPSVAKGWIFGSFIDNISPTVAPIGQAAIAYFLEKFYNVAYSKSAAAIGLYVSSWGIAASVFSAVSLALAQIFVGVPQKYLGFAVFALVFYFGAVVIWLLLLTKKKLMRKIVHTLIRPYNKFYNVVLRKDITYDSRVYDIVFDRSYASLDMVMKSKRHVASSVALFWIPQTGQVLCLYVMILGFGVHISFFGLLMVHIVSSMIGMLSIIPSGLFVYEAAVVELTGSIAPGASQFVLAAVLLYRLIFVWMTNLLGGAIGIMQGIGKIERKTATRDGV